MMSSSAVLRAALSKLYIPIHRRALDLYRAATLLLDKSRSIEDQASAYDSVASLLHGMGEEVPLASHQFNGQFNVRVVDAPRLILVAFEICRRRGWSCYLLSRGAPDPVPVTSANRYLLAAQHRRTASFRLIAADEHGRIISNNAVQTWLRSDETWIPRDARSRFGRVPDLYHLLKEVRTDIAVNFPIDAVITWVDRADPKWQELAKPYCQLDALDPERHSAYDELRAALRSLELFAPWLRKIHIFSNCSPPSWFRPTERHLWVDHGDVIDRAYLPTFNSHAIETFLHKIPSLSEHFIYLNDDFILFEPVNAEFFFAPNGNPISHMDPHPSLLPYYVKNEQGEVSDGWAQAGVNGARMILERFKYLPTRFHQHVPYSFTKELFSAIEGDYPDEMHRVRANRFRSADDVSFASFFFHHYVHAVGKGRISDANYSYVDHVRYK